MGKRLFQLMCKKKEDDANKPLTLTCIDSAGGTVELKANTTSVDISGVQYRLGGSGSWTAYTSAVSVGYMEYVQFQNTNSTLSTSTRQYAYFNLSGLFKASGNVQSMLNYSDDVPKYGLRGLFYGCTSLVTAPELPATTLADSCYQTMFYGCTSLVTAPELPAITLADYCYQNMFYGCTSLVTAHKLPATTLAEFCYHGMFYGCTSLATAPELPATTLANNCYRQMFDGCTSLATAPELPATTLVDSCYVSMFNSCTSLVTAPELPATALANYCYGYMFRGCTSLVTAPELPAITLVDSCYRDMFRGCTELNYIKVHFTEWVSQCTTYWVRNVSGSGTFYKPSALAATVGTSNIPEGWTVVNID